MKRYGIVILLAVWFIGGSLYFYGISGVLSGLNSVYFVIKSGFKELAGLSYKAYRYENVPCQGKSFTISKDVILLENKNSSFESSFYGVSRYSLQDYDKYLKDEGLDFYLLDNVSDVLATKSSLHKEIKLYKKNSSFKILGYYVHSSKIPLFSPTYTYLVKTKDGIKAWVKRIDPKSCKLTLKEIDDKSYQKRVNKEYKKVEVTQKEPKKAFSNDDKTYKISQKSYINFLKLLNPNYGKVYSQKEKEQMRFKKALKLRDIGYLTSAVRKNISFFDDKALQELKDIKPNDMSYIAMRGIYYQVMYLKKHPNSEITQLSIKYNPKTKKDDVKIVAKDSTSWSELMLAIKEKDAVKIETLLETNPQLNHTTNNGSNVLLVAIDSNDTKTYHRLLELGMDVNTKNNFGITPLHVAIISNAYEIANDLLKHGAKTDVLSKDDNPSTPFMIETRKTHVNYEMLDNLIKHGADVNRRYKHINPPLLNAARKCDKNLVDYLLKNGANKNAKDSFGKSYEDLYSENCKSGLW